jgi:hypothetical protein
VRGVVQADASSLVRRAARRRADGSRGMRARRAWRRLVQACAAGELPAQDAVRQWAGEPPGELPEADVLDLLAAAPEEPADRAAYLVLIGQEAQRQALDPDGSLLALAYRAAAPEVRQRLRALMAAEGDTEVIRVVVTGDQRDRIAEMSSDELDYLGHHLAEHHRWDELRRLARDLPIAEAVAVVRLLPPRERTGDGSHAGLPRLAERSAGELRALVAGLPRERLVRLPTRGRAVQASFSPDGSELAVKTESWKRVHPHSIAVERLRIGSGETTQLFEERRPGWSKNDSILHLGGEILLRLQMRDLRTSRHEIVRVLPDHRVLCRPSEVSDIRRSSGGGAVLLHPAGLAFADPGADRLRYETFRRFSEVQGGSRLYTFSDASCALTTLPDAGLVAFVCLHQLHVVSDTGNTVIDSASLRQYHAGNTAFRPALTFLSPQTLALHEFVGRGFDTPLHHTELWELPSQGTLHRTAEHDGPVLDRWPLRTWRGTQLDDRFVARVLCSDGMAAYSGRPDADLPWFEGSTAGVGAVTVRRELLAWGRRGDVIATYSGAVSGPGHCDVHSPHLPSAHGLLARPLLHGTPKDLQAVRRLHTRIHDPAVRDALDLLAACLAERFGGDIALGGATGSAGGPHDIALAEPHDAPTGTRPGARPDPTGHIPLEEA